MRIALLALLPTLAFVLVCPAQDATTRWAAPVGTSIIPDGIVCDLAVLDDLDADGVPDLVVGVKPLFHDTTAGFPDGFAEIRSGADGSLLHTLAPATPSSSFGLAVVATDDLDGDGLSDVGVLRHVLGPGMLYEAQVLLFSSATGGFLRLLNGPVTLPPSSPTIACVTDLNGDGVREVAICSTEGPVGPSETHFVDPLGLAPTAIIVNPISQNGQTSIAPIDDRNGDGQPDFIYSMGMGLFVASALEIRSGADLSVLGTVLPNPALVSTSNEFGQHVRVIGDVNRDGNLDLIVPDNPINACRIIDSVTGNVINTVPDGQTQYFYHQASGGLGDVDGDGFDDYYLIDEMSFIQVFSGRFHRRQSAWEGRVDLGNVVRAVAAIGDLDGDGFDDFVAGVSNEVRLLSLGGTRRLDAQSGVTLNYRPYGPVANNLGAIDLAGGTAFTPGLIAVSLGEATTPSPIMIDTTFDRVVLTETFTTDFFGEASFGVNLAQPLLAGESLFVQAATLPLTGPPVFSDALELLFVDSRMSITSTFPVGFAAGETVTVTGEGFAPGATIFLDGVPQPTTQASPGVLTITVPPTFAYDMDLVVRNPSGETVRRRVNPTPRFNGLNPPFGTAAGGALLVITGGPFLPGSTVTIGGTPATINNVVQGAIIGTTPPGTVGVAQVVVQVPAPGGGFTTLTGDYTYN